VTPQTGQNFATCRKERPPAKNPTVNALTTTIPRAMPFPSVRRQIQQRRYDRAVGRAKMFA
jgi:hypothetical protein